MTLGPSTSGKENSNDEVEAGLDKLRALAMRHDLAVVILHHLGKAHDSRDVRDPEDLWRGASRLADWAHTRVTMLPHYTAQQAEKQGMTRQQARRYVDLRFLRRGSPTEDFSIVWDVETGWWNRWANPTEVAERRRKEMAPDDIAERCRESGGSWPSVAAAAGALGVSQEIAGRWLAGAVNAGYLEPFEGTRGGRGHRLPQPRLEGP